MHNDPRYAPVAQALPEILPAITRDEAERAAKRLFKHFGSSSDRSANVEHLGPIRFSGRVRRCWISSKPTTGHFKGWGRLIHDVAHHIFRGRHPSFRPHAPGHERLELEIATYVAASGWLEGSLKPKIVKPSRDEARALKLKRLQEQRVRWEAKMRRAENALRKLKRREYALTRSLVAQAAQGASRINAASTTGIAS